MSCVDHTCHECGHVFFGHVEECPKCGSWEFSSHFDEDEDTPDPEPTVPEVMSWREKVTGPVRSEIYQAMKARVSQ